MSRSRLGEPWQRWGDTWESWSHLSMGEPCRAGLGRGGRALSQGGNKAWRKEMGCASGRWIRHCSDRSAGDSAHEVSIRRVRWRCGAGSLSTISRLPPQWGHAGSDALSSVEIVSAGTCSIIVASPLGLAVDASWGGLEGRSWRIRASFAWR